VAAAPAPARVFADRGYDHDKYRRLLRAHGSTFRIARRGIAHGSGVGRHRWVVERGFAWLHAFKRLRTRYEYRSDIHIGLLQLACALICERRLPVNLR
jgi:transposase